MTFSLWVTLHLHVACKKSFETDRLKSKLREPLDLHVLYYPPPLFKTDGSNKKSEVTHHQNSRPRKIHSIKLFLGYVFKKRNHIYANIPIMYAFMLFYVNICLTFFQKAFFYNTFFILVGLTLSHMHLS